MGDIEVGRFAVRTFGIHEGGIQSVTRKEHYWTGETCEAKCLLCPMLMLEEPHKAPEETCRCGIYGSLSYQHLREQYSECTKIVAVIAAEGKTVIGVRGLRTQYARVVAYRTPFDWWALFWAALATAFIILSAIVIFTPHQNAVGLAMAVLLMWVSWVVSSRGWFLVGRNRRIARKTFPNAKRYEKLGRLLADYGIARYSSVSPEKPSNQSWQRWWAGGEEK